MELHEMNVVGLWPIHTLTYFGSTLMPPSILLCYSLSNIWTDMNTASGRKLAKHNFAYWSCGSMDRISFHPIKEWEWNEGIDSGRCDYKLNSHIKSTRKSQITIWHIFHLNCFVLIRSPGFHALFHVFPSELVIERVRSISPYNFQSLLKSLGNN